MAEYLHVVDLDGAIIGTANYLTSMDADADLLYHLLVLMALKGIKIEDIEVELEKICNKKSEKGI